MSGARQSFATALPANDHRTLGFWSMHPFGRAANTFMLYNSFNLPYKLLGSLEFDASLRASVLFGVLSGAFNIAFRMLVDSQCKELNTTEKRALAYLTVAALPWVASLSAMKLLSKVSSSRFFQINSVPALATGFTVELMGSTNNDFLKRP